MYGLSRLYFKRRERFFSYFIMDESSGRLQPQADIQLPAEPGAVAVSPDQSHMFVALRSAKYLASYRIDAASGQLTQVSTSGQEEGPPYLYVDKTGRFLLSSYYGGGTVSVHGINDDYSLSSEPLQTLETDGHAHSIQTDRANKFAFVPHTNPANAIYQFRFEERTGVLSPNDPPKIEPETPEGPRHLRSIRIRTCSTRSTKMGARCLRIALTRKMERWNRFK